MSTSNKMLLNARVRRLDGTVTHINKINTNGYSTDAKGPQIPVKRLVLAGKSLKEIEAPFAKDECIISQGVTVKLNKRQQRELADKTLDEKALRPDFGSLVFIDPDTGKATDGKKVKVKAGAKESLKETRKHNKEPKVKKAEKVSAKNDLKDSLDLIDERKAPKSALVEMLTATLEGDTTKEQRKQFADAFGIDWKAAKKLGGKGIVKQLGRKAAQAAADKLNATVTSDAFIKQMPPELKRLMREGSLTLNKTQIERVLSALGLDTKFYAIAMQNFLGNLTLAIKPEEVKTTQKKKKAARPQYATDKDAKRRVKKMTIKLLAPDAKGMKTAKAHLKQAKAILASKLGIATKDIKRGLIVYHKNGVDYMFVACDVRGPIFIDKDGDPAVYTYANLQDTFDFTLTPTSELDAAV
ncbi:hypothetical protein HOS33_gp316 [Erwinia phage vB_EamM_Y3]|uniref:Uncharacterized protein n=1 Tax=Erwinia phage vB_EamM_Y3 TaxID=1983553 RepID=A0A2H4IBM5_9CAUD|nr:hypothetical protein HOS33_gp316 [Erwinia phage vB_EamM_Y3]ARW58956.1 hypothetical protein Y3_316 [Erwinia phage vB_EamM_Y3]